MPALSLTARIAVILLTIASLVLTILVYLAPVVSNHNISLVKVVSSTALINPGAPQNSGGLTVVIGVFGSCSRPTNTSSFKCVSSAFPGKFDLSILPGNIPKVLVPPGFFTALLWVALVFWFLGISSIYVSSVFRIERFEKYNIRTWAKIVTHVTLLLGFSIWLVVLVFYRKAAADFNACLLIQGAQAPAVVAHFGNGFYLIGPAYGCCAGIYVITRDV